MKKILRGLLALALSVSCCTSAFAAYTDSGETATFDGVLHKQVNAFKDNFNGYADVAALDAAWNGSIASMSITADDDGGNAVTVTKSGEAKDKNWQSLYKDVGTDCSRGPVVASMDIKFSDNASLRTLLGMMHWVGDIKDESGTVIQSGVRYETPLIYANDNGYITYDYAGTEKIAEYEADVWYNIKAVVDAKNHTIEYIIDDTISTKKLAVNPSFAYLTRLTPVNQAGSTATGTVTVDNCETYNLSELMERDENGNMVKLNGVSYSVYETMGDDFDDYTTAGAVPTSNSYKSDGINVADFSPVTVDAEHGTSVKIIRTGEDNSYLRRQSSMGGVFPQSADGGYIIEGEYRFDNNASRFLLDANSITGYEFIKTEGGYIKTGNSGVVLAPYQVNTWYKISSVVDIDNKKQHFYVDDILRYSKDITSYGQPARITLGQHRGTNSGSTIIDNFSVKRIIAHPETGEQITYNNKKYEKVDQYSNDFTAYTAQNASPTDWVDSTTISSVQYDTSHGNSVKVIGDASNGWMEFTSNKAFNTSDIYLFSADYLLDNVASASGKRLMLLNPIGEIINVSRSKINAGGASIPCEDYRWYRIEVLVDFVNHQYTVFVDGEILGSPVTIGETVSGILKVTQVQRNAGNIYMDNYRVSKLISSIDNETDGKSLISLYNDGFGFDERKTSVNTTPEYIRDADGFAMKVGDKDDIVVSMNVPATETAYEKYIFSQDIKFSDITQSRYLFALRYTDGTNSEDVITIKTVRNQIKKGDDTVLAEYKANKWYNIQMIADIANNTYDVYLDKAYIGSGTMSFTKTTDDRTLVAVKNIASWGSTHNDVYLDNAQIMTAAEYEAINTVSIYYDDEVLTDPTEPFEGDTITAVPDFDTTGCMVIIAAYNGDGTLADVSVTGEMTVGAWVNGDEYTLKAFVFDSTTFKAECAPFEISKITVEG